MSRVEMSDADWRIQHLPALSEVAADALKLMAAGDVPLGKLENLVNRDQALVLRILRIANSPFYGLSRRVATIHDAIVLLGLETVRGVIAAAAVMHIFPDQPESGMNRSRFWTHSVQVAAAGKLIAEECGFDAGIAFCAGLLHDVGRLVMEFCFPENYARVAAACDAGEMQITTAELSHFAFDHGQMGGRVASGWHLPDSIHLAIAAHHCPAADHPNPIVDVIHAGDILAHGLGTFPEDLTLVPGLDAEVWRRLDLGESLLAQLLPRIDKLSRGMQLL